MRRLALFGISKSRMFFEEVEGSRFNPGKRFAASQCLGGLCSGKSAGGGVEPSGRIAPPRKFGVLCVPGLRFNPSERLISELTLRNKVGAERDGGKSSPPQGVR